MPDNRYDVLSFFMVKGGILILSGGTFESSKFRQIFVFQMFPERFEKKIVILLENVMTKRRI